MSGGAIAAIIAASSAASTSAIAIAAAAKKKKEEEKMAGYRQGDLDGWEFKIVRSLTNKFRSGEAVRKVCEEEARAGWELIEKFDDQRLRFKRRVERRSRDLHLEQDAYRTSVGFGGGKINGVVVGICLLAVGLIMLGVLYWQAVG